MPLTKRLVYVERAAMLALGVLIFATTGCKRQEPEKEPPSLPPEVVQSDETPQILPLADFPLETYGDEKLLHEPRLQFRWRRAVDHPSSIWSMKLDGTDVRQTVSPEVLFSGEARNLQQTPIRSPDNRYIACVGDDANGDQLRYLVDLKTHSVRTMMKDTYGAAHFNWTPDSKRVLFYGDIKLWEYNVDSGDLKQLPMVYSSGLFSIDNGKRLVAVKNESVEYRDRTGKLIHTVKLPFVISTTGQNHHNAVSPDGKTLAFLVGAKTTVIRADSPDQIIYSDERPRLQKAFSPDGRSLFAFDRGDLTVLDLASGESKIVARFHSIGPSGLSMFNLGKPQ